MDALSYHLRERGVIIRHREEYDRVEPCDDGAILHLKSGKQLKTDVLLWAAGRTGNSDGLGLEAIGVQPDTRGNIPVNQHMQTVVPHIYAVGDVIGPPALAVPRRTIKAAMPPRKSSVKNPHRRRRSIFQRASTPARKSARSARPNVS